MSCVASFAVFVPSLKTVNEETDRLSCLLYVRGQCDHWVGVRAMTKSQNQNMTHPHACVTRQSYLHKHYNNI